MNKQFILILFLSFVFSFANSQSDADVLMTVGDTDVTIGEFKYIYEKNNGEEADYSEESINEYLELYKKFKLKVARAYDMELDTINELQQELEGYRNQLADNYLIDRQVVDQLVDEMYDRKKEDVLASHILITLRPSSTKKQKLDARKKLENFKQQLREGKSFSQLAKQFSEDSNTKENGGQLGYITATLPNGFYNLENALYDLDIGEVSDPLETKLGMHIVKIINKRPARGKIEVAHIFKKLDDKSGNNPKRVKSEIDSIYALLSNGASFESLALKYTDDKTTKNKGGKLPAFGIAVYDKVFEEASFGLKNNGDFTKPIKTSVGYHIIKKINKPAPETKEELKLRFKDKMTKQDRFDSAQNVMIEGIKETSQFNERKQVLNTFIGKLDESFYSYKWKPDPNLGDNVLVTFGKNEDVSISDFAKYAKSQTRLRSKFDKNEPLQGSVTEVYDEFIKEKAFEFERANLESKYPDFASLMREYREGILLFEATKVNVWDKANLDTLGLYQYYENNNGQYIYEKQAVMGSYIINSTDEKLLKKIKKYIKKKDSEKVLAKYNKDGVELIEYSEQTVETGHKDLIGLNFEKKYTSEPFIDTNNRKSLIKKILEIKPSRRKTLKEARGYVIADYQDQLEQKWVKELKKVYPIKVNENTLKSIIK